VLTRHPIPAGPVTAPVRGRRVGRWLRARASTIAILVIWVIWQLVASFELVAPTVLLPGPIALLGTAGEMIRDGSLPDGRP